MFKTIVRWGKRITLLEPLVWLSGLFLGLFWNGVTALNSIPSKADIINGDDAVRVEIYKEFDRRAVARNEREALVEKRIEKIEAKTDRIDDRTFDMARSMGVKER